MIMVSLKMKQANEGSAMMKKWLTIIVTSMGLLSTSLAWSQAATPRDHIETLYMAVHSYDLMEEKGYPEKLEDLTEVEPPYFWKKEQVQYPDYHVEYNNLDHDFEIRMTPNNGDGVSYFVNSNGDVRMNKNGPADLNSPLAP